MRLEVNMIVNSSIEASDYYKNMLQAEIISTTNNQGIGTNEAMLKIGGAEIRILDENESLGLVVPKKIGGSVWICLYVDDLESYFNHAVKNGANIMSPIQEIANHGLNSIITDKFNHVWVVNQLY